MSYRLGVDIGGTFTDTILVNDSTGDIRIGKVSSTPADPSIGFLEATDRILTSAGVSPNLVRYVVHGTTVATNAVIEGKGARTAFLTTAGFRDMLEIARQMRPSLYDLRFTKVPPLIPRELCFEVQERLDARGQIMTPLDEEALRSVASELRRENVESVAVCFLHAYLNPQHERRAGELLRAELPGVFVSLSSDVAPEFREYFRASTTAVNASVRPVVERYLSSIEVRLRDRSVRSELLVMQSNGGVLSFHEASERPVFMVESGPAAGVIGAAQLGTLLGYEKVISFDMGGTTAKAALVEKGTPRVTKEYEVGVSARTGVGASRGGGYPIRTPVIDLVEIGAGGGSIAWIDGGGGLRVGPDSAGASPGPACYGNGNDLPTVTDANLVMGRLNPDFFLGGEIRLDVELARKAIESKCALPLGLDLMSAANGIVEIANAAMVNALRLVSVQRGFDPREFVLVAFGGAGPAHANRLAAEMGIRTTVIPVSPGTASALGLLMTDLRHEFSRTLLQPLDQLDPAQMTEAFGELERQGTAALKAGGAAPEDISFVRQVDLRYLGQSYELTVPLADTVDEMLVEFHREHDRVYGFASPGEPAEVVTLRLTAIGRIKRPALRELPHDPASAQSALKGHRPVYFAEAQGFVPCPIYDRYGLCSGAMIHGPAVVEELDSTATILPGYQADVDLHGNLIVTEMQN